MPKSAPAEMTYEETNHELDAISSECEGEIARLQLRRIAEKIENLLSAGVKGGVVDHLTDVDDSVQRQIEAAQAALDSAQAAKAANVRDHGAGQEYHDAAPGGGAEKTYFGR